MQRNFIFIILISSFLSACTQNKDIHKKVRDVSKKDYHTAIKIPSTWIEKIRNYNYKQNNAPLLHEFDSFIKPDSLFLPDFEKDLDKGKPGVLNPIFVNLDDDANEELICTIGWDENYPSMAVFKKIGADWQLLYLEDYYMFYSMPDLYVSNSYSINKTFYFRRVYERGSGVYSDGYSFFKLINNKVYPCLELVNDAHISGWMLFVNQEVKMDFNFSGTEGDQIWVKYDYSFFTSADKESISLVKGENGIGYTWNSKLFKYENDNQSDKNEVDELNAAKISCFGAFGNDSLFVHAFDAEINQTLKIASPIQKKIIRQYLNLAKKNRTVTSQQ
jgi:hypothetical protein